MKSRECSSAFANRKAGTTVAVCAGLVAMVALIFGQTIFYGFVNYDDSGYVYENPKIIAGLSLSGLGWAFSHFHSTNWHPLTTISHMADCQAYGLYAGGHHFTNLLFHAAAAVSLFLVLRGMTGATWRSAFVAAFFAVHPLHVESVAWISERKDVLSALFFVLTLGAYICYVHSCSVSRYLLVALLLALGLMAKPMLVTTPFVLLLVDYWPLGRFNGRPKAWSLFLEKIPLLVLSAASCVTTFFAQKGVIIPAEQFPISSRIGNAFVSYLVYIRQMFWPARLSPLYPFPEDRLPLWLIALALLLVAFAGVLAIWWRKERPYIFTGWFWYFGMLVPVIGIVQVGIQSHADRYTYLPEIGLYVVVAWGMSDLAKRLRIERLMTMLAGATIILLAIVSWSQAKCWRNGETLWTQALAATERNDVAHYGLGDVFARHGQIDKSISEFRAALNIRPQSPYSQDYLGLALLKKGQIDEAIGHFQTALGLMPNHPTARFDLANALFQKGDVDDAIERYQEGLAQKSDRISPGFVQPDYGAAHYGLGNCYIQRGQLQRAVKEYQEALRFWPHSPQVHNNLAFALSRLGQTREAIAEWQEALHIQSNNIEVLGNLAWILATSPDTSIRDGPRALDLVERAQDLSKSNPKILRILAAARAETGNFEAAIEAAREGLDLANKEGDASLANSFQSDLLLYEAKTALGK
jgi:protein O-mannosyl-transferase